MDFSTFGHPAPEWTDFIAAHPSEASPARLPTDKSPTEIQSETNAQRQSQSLALFEKDSLASAVKIEEIDIRRSGSSAQDKLTARVYTKVLGPEDLELDKVPGVVYYHGGGYVFGTPETERHLCSLMAAKLRVVVVHVCYREAPQHRHPAGHRDGKDGFEWVVENAEWFGIDPEQIVVVGLSCGAGIAASTCLAVCNEDSERSGGGDEEPRSSPRKRKRSDEDEDGGEDKQEKKSEGKGGSDDRDDDDAPTSPVVSDRFSPPDDPGRKKARIKGLLLGFPWLLQESSFPYDMFASREVASRVQCADAPCMSKAVYDRLVDMLGAEDPADLRLNIPLAKDKELARFPRTGFIIAGMDMFRDDGLLFAEKLRQLGVPRRVHMFPGMPHSFRKYDELPSSKRFDELFLLLTNWALDRTVSSQDTGFHVEHPADSSQRKSQENNMQKPPYETRYN